MLADFSTGKVIDVWMSGHGSHLSVFVVAEKAMVAALSNKGAFVVLKVCYEKLPFHANSSFR